MVITYKHYSKPKITRSLDSKQVYYTNLYAEFDYTCGKCLLKPKTTASRVTKVINGRIVSSDVINVGLMSDEMCCRRITIKMIRPSSEVRHLVKTLISDLRYGDCSDNFIDSNYSLKLNVICSYFSLLIFCVLLCPRYLLVIAPI